ncbi:type III secretion system cytoplasmic ring protein SctQ [Trinickia sp. LjRoot230]|uniref:type III secretion system cytoplasmic ring protein SctQ n=1 Tax=Trinickia sp. LjRoot230 TaxID=3342288 RepID=UPI003ECDF076
MEQIFLDSQQQAEHRPLSECLARVSRCGAALSRLAGSTAFIDALTRNACVNAMSVTPPRAQIVRSGTAEIAHDCGTARIAFDLSRHAAVAIVAKPASAPSSMALREAVSALLLAPLLRQLNTLGFSGLRIMSLQHIEPTKQVRSLPPLASVALHTGGQTIEFDVVTASDQFLSPLDVYLRADSPLRAPLPPTLADLNLPGSARLGTQRIKTSTLNTLRTGDVLLGGVPAHYRACLDSTRAPLSLELAWGGAGSSRVAAIGTLVHTTLSIKEGPNMRNDTQDTDINTMTAEDFIDMSDFELPVHLEVETVHLTLGQISTLSAGYVMELPVPLAESRVRLVAYGQTIGHGELVAVGEHLGLRIIQMGASPDATH